MHIGEIFQRIVCARSLAVASRIEIVFSHGLKLFHLDHGIDSLRERITIVFKGISTLICKLLGSAEHGKQLRLAKQGLQKSRSLSLFELVIFG
jgi:hypothetical protein